MESDDEDEGVFLASDAVDDGDGVSESDFSYITVTTPGHEVSEGWPTVLNTWRNRALAAGWEVKVGHSVAHHAERLWKNGSTRSPEQVRELWWINAVKDGKYITVTYTFAAGKALSQFTSRTVRGVYRLLSDKGMQEVIKGEQ